MNRGIELSIIYIDDHLLEMRVAASNGVFSGRVDIYLAHSIVSDMMEILKGFPMDPDDSREIKFSEGEPYTLATATLRFFCINSIGHSQVDVALHHYSKGGEVPANAAFSIDVNIGEIDEFSRQMANMKLAVGQTAFLRSS